MWKGDPPESMPHGAGKRDPFHWRRADEESAPFWEEQIYTLLGDGEPRTFNRICIEIFRTTASTFLDSNFERGLWRLVEGLRIAWACEEEAVFWIRADFLLPNDSGGEDGG